MLRSWQSWPTVSPFGVYYGGNVRGPMANGFILDSDAFLRFFEARIGEFPSLRAAARRWRVSAAYLSDLRHGRREPGPKILKALRLTKKVRVVRTVRYHG
jgi:hypothetical protein